MLADSKGKPHESVYVRDIVTIMGERAFELNGFNLIEFLNQESAMREGLVKAKIKYLHVLNVNEPKFSLWIVKQVKNKQYFHESEWGYVTPYKKLYELLLENGAKNVFLEENSKTIIDEYAPFVDILFLHAWDDRISIFNIKKSSLKKCVWRTWGHDVYPFVKNNGRSIKTLKHNILAYLRRKKAKKCLTFAIANIVDEVKMKSVFGKEVELFRYSYTSLDASKIVFEPIKQSKEKRILIGHSMYPSEHHLDVLETLKQFKNEDVKITLISIYGFDEYEKMVLSKATEIFGDKVENITERKPLESYLQFLNTVDVAILSDKSSSALGTLTWLAKLHKKVYVYGDGDLAKGINHAGCMVNRIEDIKNQSFEEFISYDVEQCMKMQDDFGKVSTEEECCERILTIINALKYNR